MKRLPLGGILSLCETEKWRYRLEMVNLASINIWLGGMESGLNLILSKLTLEAMYLNV